MEAFIPPSVGNVRDDVVLNMLRHTHQNIEDSRHNSDAAKDAMAEFIGKHCRTLSVRSPPTEGFRYSLSLAGREGLIMRIKENDDIAYVFNVVTGNVYILEWQHGEIGTDGKPQKRDWTFNSLGSDYPFGLLFIMVMGRGSMRPRVIQGRYRPDI